MNPEKIRSAATIRREIELSMEWMRKSALAAKAGNPTLAAEAAARAIKHAQAALDAHDELNPPHDA